MRTHVTVLGWLQILLGVVDLVIAALVFGVFAGVAALGSLLGEPVFPFVGALGTVIASVIVLTAVPNLLAGLGLLARKPWARILALVLAVFNLAKFPWGTVLAAYTFWVLLQERTRELFRAV